MFNGWNMFRWYRRSDEQMYFPYFRWKVKLRRSVKMTEDWSKQILSSWCWRVRNRSRNNWVMQSVSSVEKIFQRNGRIWSTLVGFYLWHTVFIGNNRPMGGYVSKHFCGQIYNLRFVLRNNEIQASIFSRFIAGFNVLILCPFMFLCKSVWVRGQGSVKNADERPCPMRTVWS